MKGLFSAAIIAAFIIVAGGLEDLNSTYIKYGEILQTVGSITLVMDTDGEIWELENNPLPDNRKVRIVFHDNLTPGYIYDDVIRDIQVE